MRAVVMAGGFGTRLRPYLADGLNKHIVPVGDRPLICHSLRTLQECGVRDVLIVLDSFDPGSIVRAVGSGAKYGMSVYFRCDDMQDIKAGPAGHLLMAEDFVAGEQFMLLLGDAFYLPGALVSGGYQNVPFMWTMELCPLHDDPAKYGHVMVEGPRVIALRDRPKDVVAPSLIQTGAWMFQPSVFDIVRELCDNRFKELRLNDVIVYMLTHGPVVHHLTITPGTFIDCGDVASVQCATNIWRKHTI